MLRNRGFPEAWSCLCICQASFLMTFAMGGVPHVGPLQFWNVMPKNQAYQTDVKSKTHLIDKVSLYCARNQREELGLWQRSWGRRLGIRKGMIKPQETPCSRASTPKTRVFLLYCFRLSPTLLTLWGAVPHRFSRRRSKRAAPSQ